MARPAQVEAALALLAKTGIWPSNYAPPIFHLLWRMGVNIPPPHFIGFAAITFGAGLIFGGIWGLMMWSLFWSGLGWPAMTALLFSAFTGVTFGLAMACYYAYGRRQHRLPSWQSLAGK